MRETFIYFSFLLQKIKRNQSRKARLSTPHAGRFVFVTKDDTQGDHLSAGKDGPGKATPALPSSPLPGRGPEGSSIPHGCRACSSSPSSHPRSGKPQTWERPVTPGQESGACRAVPMVPGEAGGGSLAQAPAVTSLVPASPRPCVALAAGPAVCTCALDKLCPS